MNFAGGSAPSVSLTALLRPDERPAETDTRTGDEIAADIMRKAGIEVRG